MSYDRRGFGRSDKPDAGYSFDGFADDLAAVIEQTGVRDATSSAIRWAAARWFATSRATPAERGESGPGRRRGLLSAQIANNPAGLDAAVFDGMQEGVRGDRKAFLAGLLTDVFFDVKRPSTVAVTPEMLDAALAMAMQASVPATVGCIDAFSTTDFRPELAAVKVPTLILHGTADIPVPFALARQRRQVSPDRS